MSPRDVIALYCMPTHFMGVTSDPEWWHLGLCLHLVPGFAFTLCITPGSLVVAMES